MRKLSATMKKRVEKLNVHAPLPYLRKGRPAIQFNLLRREVERQAGFDFLGTCDLLRLRGFISKKPSVSARSRHICGDAFDINTDDERVCLIGEPIDGKQYWRVLIKSENAGGRFKFKCELRGVVEGHFIDFTKLASKFGFTRIAAWPGWSHDGAGAVLREFWHFQLADNLTWNEAVSFLYGRHRHRRPIRIALMERTFGLNDRGLEIHSLQSQLSALEYLPAEEVNAIFGAPTQSALKTFQRKRRLEVSGLAEPDTRRLLALDLIRRLAPAEGQR